MMSPCEFSERDLHQYFCNTALFSLTPLNKKVTKNTFKITFAHHSPNYFKCRVIFFFELKFVFMKLAYS